MSRAYSCEWSEQEEPLTRYYKSRPGERPAIFVQEEGQWRAYAANGAQQRSTGVLPVVILARIEEISPAEGEALIAAWKARARMAQDRQPAPPSAVPALERPGSTPSASAGPFPTVDAPSVPSRPLSRRLVYVFGAAAIVVAGLVLAVLATTGHLGTGATASTSSSSGTTGSTSVEVAGEDLVATVGEHRIGRQQLDQKIADFQAQYPGQIPDKDAVPDQYTLFQQGALDYLVTYQLVSQEAEVLAVEVTDDEVENEMAFILDVSYGGDQTRFESAVAEQGLTMDQFRRIYKESLLFNKVYAEVTKAATVSDSEIETYYEQHKTDSYADKSLADVKEEIRSALLDAKQRSIWSDWLDRERQTIGVSYANGWTAPADSGALVP